MDKIESFEGNNDLYDTAIRLYALKNSAVSLEFMVLPYKVMGTQISWFQIVLHGILPDAANSWRWRGRPETFHHHYHYHLTLTLPQKMLFYLSRSPVNYTTCKVNHTLFIFSWEIFLDSWSNIFQNSLSMFYKLVCSTWKTVNLKRASRTSHDIRKAEQSFQSFLN